MCRFSGWDIALNDPYLIACRLIHITPHHTTSTSCQYRKAVTKAWCRCRTVLYKLGSFNDHLGVDEKDNLTSGCFLCWLFLLSIPGTESPHIDGGGGTGLLAKHSLNAVNVMVTDVNTTRLDALYNILHGFRTVSHACHTTRWTVCVK